MKISYIELFKLERYKALSIFIELFGLKVLSIFIELLGLKANLIIFQLER